MNGSIPQILVFGHSFVRRLRDDLVSHFDSRGIKQNFNLASSAGVYLHGIGGRTVDKVFQYDLPFLKSQHSDIIIFELDTNVIMTYPFCLPRRWAHVWRI